MENIFSIILPYCCDISDNAIFRYKITSFWRQYSILSLVSKSFLSILQVLDRITIDIDPKSALNIKMNKDEHNSTIYRLALVSKFKINTLHIKSCGWLSCSVLFDYVFCSNLKILYIASDIASKCDWSMFINLEKLRIETPDLDHYSKESINNIKQKDIINVHNLPNLLYLNIYACTSSSLHNLPKLQILEVERLFLDKSYMLESTNILHLQCLIVRHIIVPALTRTDSRKLDKIGLSRSNSRKLDKMMPSTISTDNYRIYTTSLSIRIGRDPKKELINGLQHIFYARPIIFSSFTTKPMSILINNVTTVWFVNRTIVAKFDFSEYLRYNLSYTPTNLHLLSDKRDWIDKMYPEIILDPDMDCLYGMEISYYKPEDEYDLTTNIEKIRTYIRYIIPAHIYIIWKII